MAITVEVGQCLDDNRCLKKTVTGGWTPVQGSISFRDSANLHDPVFTITDTQSAQQFNYCRIRGIDGLDRYYYAEVVNVRTNVYQVICTMDVLMTYCNYILQCKGLVKRCCVDGEWNSYLYDSVQQKQVNCQISSKILHSFDYANNGSIIVGVVGAQEQGGYQ